MIYAIAIFMLALLGGSLWLNVRLVGKNLVLEDQREELVDQIEESLDMLDDVYTKIAHSAEIPVLSDDPIIKDLLHDIRRAKNAVLAIASKVVIYGTEPGEKDEG